MLPTCHATDKRIGACIWFPGTVHRMLRECSYRAHSRKVVCIVAAGSIVFAACSPGSVETSIPAAKPDPAAVSSVPFGSTPLPYVENEGNQVPGTLLPSNYSKMFSLDIGGEVGVGDTGPGSGIVVYVDIDDKYPDFDFMEVYLGESPTLPFMPSSLATDELYAETSKSLGFGKINSEKIVAEQGPGSYAAKYSMDLQAGGFSDWFLPSLEEMDAVCRYAAGTNNDPKTTDYTLCARTKNLKFGQFEQYWTSSHANSSYTWIVVLGFGHTVSENTRLQKLFVSPVRYFN